MVSWPSSKLCAVYFLTYLSVILPFLSSHSLPTISHALMFGCWYISNCLHVLSWKHEILCVTLHLNSASQGSTVFVSCYHQHMVYIEQCLHATLCLCSVVVILLECPTSSHADAGDIIASHLPKWKNLRKVEVYEMNPVPILVVVGSCGNLDEVVIWDPEHCTVGFPAL